VLSQVDSSVGGKTGVNLPEAKNMVGAFHQPALVLADVDTLKSLPKREWNEGFAEIIKHACIRDASMLDAIHEVATGGGDLLDLIARNICIKARIVEADEHETLGLRALLNFGHTLGHAIEAAAGYGQLLHGEAISLGLHAALHLSCTRAGLSAAEVERVLALLRAFELPIKLSPDFDEEQLLKITRMDKKFERGSIRFVLLKRLGESFVSQELTEDDLRAALAAIRV
jgi:3-dehydroquinate synthetase